MAGMASTGSLAAVEAARIQAGRAANSGLEAARNAGNISTGTIGSDSMLIMDDTQLKAQAEHEEALAMFDRRKLMREIALPPTDKGVKLKLRSLDQAICLFGEEARDRRERLREMLAREGDIADEMAAAADGEGAAPREEEDDGRPKDDRFELFYTEGSEELQKARQWIARDSLPQAGERIAVQKRRRTEIAEAMAAPGGSGTDEVEVEALAFVKEIENRSSQIGDDRPISSCAFRQDGALLASGSWSGVVKLWGLPDCRLEERGALRGHTERVTGVAFHPKAGKEAGCNQVVSCGADTKVLLWDVDAKKAQAKLEGHFDVVSSVAYHPSGRLLLTTSFDKTWRLWDLETQQSLLVQEGHSQAVYASACQVDGSLAATCGLDCVGRVWDLRSGKCILVLQGHVKQILGIDFNPTGYQVATGSADHTVRIWDLRKKNCAYIIPAHSALVSHVKYQPVHGKYLLTTSYDKTCKAWNARSFQHVKTLGGHENKIMACDISSDSKYLATASYDRTWKLWGQDMLNDLDGL